MIIYRNHLEDLTPNQLQGFYVGWGSPPSPDTHLRILQNSYAVVLAVDEDSGQVVGFINAISDGIQAAYIPTLEVLPSYQGQGIGSELVQRILQALEHVYMVDIVCDVDLNPFYERFDMMPYNAMIRRQYQNQSGT